MVFNNSSRHNNPHARKLVRAGYRRLPQYLLALAKLRLVDPFADNPALLPRRKVTALARVSASGRYCCRLSVATTGLVQERAAAKLSVSCYSLFGKKLPSGDPNRPHMLFADPLDDLEPQPVSFEVPKGTFWITTTIERLTDTRHVGVVGSMRPEAAPLRQGDKSAGSLEHALQSRDRLLLEAHLEQARVDCDRKTAHHVLARLVFLDHREHDQSLLRYIDDIQHTLDHLGPVHRQEHDIPGFDYKELQTTPWKNSMLLSRWLKSEALDLNRRESPVVSIGAGPDRALRLMAAVYAGKKITFDGTGDWDTDTLPWLSKADIDVILALTHESAPL